MSTVPSPNPEFSDLSNEELAARCAQGIDAAERELLQRHMQGIYWLPHRLFGTPEEVLSDFLLYAVDKIRERDILAKYDAQRGARFSTWFAIVLRRLFLDYLRARPQEPGLLELRPDAAATAPAEVDTEPPTLLNDMENGCRVLFKLLLCNAFSLTPAEYRWIAETSGRTVVDVAREVAALEERLRATESQVQDRYDKLAVVHWWNTHYQKQMQALEREAGAAPDDPRYEKTLARLRRRREEYERLVADLAGHAGLATVPYKDLAALLNLKEGTLASRISRCRAKAAEILLQRRQQNGGNG